MIINLKPWIFLSLLFTTLIAHTQSTQLLYLSGTDKDHKVDWEFKVTGGRNSGEWTTIPVPSCWEMQGFGTYRYWSDWGEDPAPDSVGNYRYAFEVPRDWQGKVVNIVFEGAMTDTEVKINGKLAGPIHQGGFYEFRYDISGLLSYGASNVLEVEVHRFSTNHSVNLAERRADFWMFSGIFRPVYLEVLPRQHIERFAVDAKHTGQFSVAVFPKNISSSSQVFGQIESLDGTPIGEVFSAQVKKDQQKASLATFASDIKPWSAEWPNLYRIRVTLKKGDDTLHTVSEKFGFRTIEVRKGDGVYVNDQKVRLRGTNRHTFWPTSGRTTSKDLSIMDAHLIKDMNMNAVRMSHYPPDKHFLEVTDSLGLYVIDELTGWQDAYDTEVGEKLIQELIVRDVNHPSIILWANGNEGGWNYELDSAFSLWDSQNRTVIHPWDNFGGINTSHYEVYDCCTGSFFHGDDLFMPTEFLHGLYDGGNGAGLEDWWNLMLDNPLAVGGFLWAFADEGIVRDDQEGRIDVAGNAAPDGIVGPYREKEGSFYTIKKVWSPLNIELGELDLFPVTFDGNLKVENHYDHTNLRDVTFSWKLVDFPGPMSDKEIHIADSGEVVSPDVAPSQSSMLSIDFPADWQNHDGLYLTATDPHGREIYTWSWMLSNPKAANQFVSTCLQRVQGMKKNDIIAMEACAVSVQIDAKTGMLSAINAKGADVPLNQGPRQLEGAGEVEKLTHGLQGDSYVVDVQLSGSLKTIQWTLQPDGWLKLNYAYEVRGDSKYDAIGVTFNFPEEGVTGLTWLGKGPYRVWKNRTKGMEFGIWQKAYNDTATGESWEYPEFKGFHSDMYWAKLETRSQPITMVFTSADTYLRLFTPREGPDPRTTHVEFPEGDISILKGISPIGTKFYSAEVHGPAGEKNFVQRHGRWIEDEVYFYFGE